MKIKTVLIALAVFSLAIVIASPLVSAAGPTVICNPDNGLATTISGSGFAENSPITLTWGTGAMSLTTIPTPLQTDNAGNFVCQITALNQDTSDNYIITATDGALTSATGWFVVNNYKGATGATGAIGAAGTTGATGATGATGVQGPKGDKGDTGATGGPGSPGMAGSDTSGAIALVALALAAIGFLFGIIACMRK